MDKNVDFVSNIVGGLTKALETAFPKRAPHEEWCEDYCGGVVMTRGGMRFLQTSG